MSTTECINAFRMAVKREVTDDEIVSFLESMEAHKRYLKAKDVTLTDAEASLQAAKEVGQRLQTIATIEKRNAAINYTKRLEHVGWVLNTFGKNPALGLETLLAGSQRAKDKARMGVLQVQAALSKRYTAGFITDLERTNALPMFTSGTLDRDVSRALWLLNDEKADLSKLPAEAVSVAKVIRKWQEVTRLDANDAGAWIGKRSDYIVRQAHDSERIRRAGFDEWAKVARETFDIPAMMREHGVVSEKEMLQATYNNLATSNHLKEAPDDVTGFKGPGNIAKKLSQSRSILFKDADAWFDYNQQFGVGNLREAVMRGLQSSADSIGLMRTMGTNPAAMFDAIRDDVTLQMKAANNLDAVTAIDSKRDEYARYLAAADGSMNRPGSELWARRSANIRAWITLSKLGGMVLSQLNDVAVYASGVRYQGRGFFSGMYEAVSGLGRGLSAPERRELAASLGVVLDNMAAEIGRVGSFSEPGNMTHAMRVFMKLNLSQWWTSRMRTSAAFGMSHHLALQSSRDFGNLGAEYQRVLGLYGIGEPEWNAIRQASKRHVDGMEYITPEEVAALPDDVIRKYAGDAASDAAIRRERDALAEKVRVYFTDQTETLALEPDAKTRAIMLQGTRPGTWTGEMARFIMQFKSFTGAYMQRVIGRELYGRGYEGSSVWGALRHGNGEFTGLASLIVTTTLLGYASMALKDLAKGRTPRDPTESPEQAKKVMLAALLQGGGAGIYGDFLFGEASRFGSGFVEQLAGPAISTGADIVDLYHKAIHGDDVAANAFNTAVNNTPFLNLFYTRAALNYMVLYGMQESMNPGYLRRMERRMEQEQAQSFILPPSQYANQ